MNDLLPPRKLNKINALNQLKQLYRERGIHYTLYRITESGQIVMTFFDFSNKRYIDVPVYIDYNKKTVIYKNNIMSIQEWEKNLTFDEMLL